MWGKDRMLLCLERCYVYTCVYGAGSGPEQHCHQPSRWQTGHVRLLYNTAKIDTGQGLRGLSRLTPACLSCRDAMKKAIERLKLSSQTQDAHASGHGLLESIKHIDDQIQAASPESLPAILEGSMHLCCKSWTCVRCCVYTATAPTTEASACLAT